jgi:iron complex outermembrane recepter protein
MTRAISSRSLESRAVSALLALAASGIALADTQLEEITVTAQRRAQNIQDVPIAVSALTAEALQQKGVNDVQQITNFIANVNIDSASPFSGSTSVLSAYVRGIGQNDFAFNFDPGVGVYVDGVYLARTVGANVDMLDVERIEVLKGPQGTLFGRNTIGGAINIVTRRPAEDFDWHGEIIAGDFDRRDLRGSVDLPLVDGKLLSSIAFSSKYRDGYQKRIPFPSDTQYNVDGTNAFLAAGYQSSEREGGQDEQNIRGKLLWMPGDDVEITFAGDHGNVDQSATPNTVLATHSGPTDFFARIYNTCINTSLAQLNDPNDPLQAATFTNIGLPPGGFVPGYAPLNTTDGLCSTRGPVGGYPPNTTVGVPQTSFAAVNVDADPNNDRLPYDDRFLTNDIDTTYATGNSFSKLDTNGFSVTADWKINDGLALKSISGYRDLKWDVGMDLDGSPLEMLHTSFNMIQRQASEEIQLSGKSAGDRLDWVVGGYYFREAGHLTDFVTFSEGLLQIFGPNDLETKASALFTHLNFRLNDLVGFTVGARYTKEDKKFEGFQQDLDGFNVKLLGIPAFGQGFPDPNNPLRYFPPGVNSKSFNDVSPRLGIELHPSGSVMIYASYSEGFKSGSWTTRLSNPLPVAPDFDAENATAYEIGVKSELADRRVILNAAAFFTDYNNIQLNFQQGVSPTFENAGDARIKGAEVEFQGLITDNFSITAGLGVLRAEYTSIEAGTLGITLDSDLPKTPQTTFYIGPHYSAPLSNGARIEVNVDYSYRAAVFNDTENTPLLRRPSTDNVNASLLYLSAGGKWDVGIGGTNLTDDRYLITGQAQIAGGQTYGTYNRPREYWATLRVRH